MSANSGKWANASRLQRFAVAATFLNVILLMLLQFVLTSGEGAPAVLFMLFIGIWLFGAAMLLIAPRFGAVGTAAWGLLAAGAAFRTHRSLDASNLTVILASLLAAVLAILFLVERVRGPSRRG